LGNDIAQGLACLLTLYFLVSFTVQAFVDYNAWQFQRERQMTKPYLDLVNLVVSRASVTGEQIKNACDGLVELKATSGFEKKLDSALGQLKSIEKSLGEFLENTQPLLTHWAGTIRSMDRLNARLRVRFISLWTLDIVLPVALGALAIYATRSGIGSLMFRIAG